LGHIDVMEWTGINNASVSRTLTDYTVNESRK